MIEKLNNEVGSDWKSVVVMLFFVVPFFRPTIINDWAAVSVLKSVFAIWLLAACAVAVARFIARNGRIGLFLLGLASMLLVMYISTFAHGGSSYDAMINTAMILSSALLVTTLKKREVRPFLLALAGLLLVLVASELVLRFAVPQGIYRMDGGARWILENGSLQSRWCFVLVFAAGALDYMKKGRYGLFFYLCAAISLLLVLRLASATSTVALVAEVVIFIFAGNKRFQRALTCRRVNLVFIVLVIAIVFLRIADYLPYDSIASFLGKDLRFMSGATFTGRTYIWDSVISSIAQSPLFGYGYQQFVATDIYQFYSQTNYGSAHDLWLQIAFQGGFVGLLCFLLAYFSLCHKADAAGLGRARTLFVGLLIAFLLTSIFENTLNSTLILALAIPTSGVMLEAMEGRAVPVGGGVDAEV